MVKGFPDLPPVWATGAAALAWALAEWLPIWRHGEGRIAGVVLFALGLASMIWAVIWFVRKRTPIEPHESPRTLIVEGPFRINRNPIYSGMALGVFGIALWLGAVSALIPAFALPLILTRRFVLPEEARLRERFGAEAEAWFARTRRW